MNQRELAAERLRAALEAIEQPYLEWYEGLRDLLAMKDFQGRQEIWRILLDEKTYWRWLTWSGLLGQVEWSAA